MAEITGAVHHVNLSVTDPERSAAWYTELFGLTRVAELQDPDGRWTKVILRHPGGLLLGFTAHRANTGEPFDEVRTGLDHVAFAVADAAALAAWEQRLTELQIEHSPVKQSPLGQLITLRDPDHVQLEVYAANE